MGLVDRINSRLPARSEQRSSIDAWLSDYFLPAQNQFVFGGTSYPFGLNQTLAGSKAQEFSATLPGYSAALRSCPPAFAAQMVRALVLSQARFTFRNLPGSKGTARKLFGTPALTVLEQPWTNGTTGELLSRMEWHAGVAGNAFVYRRPDRLRVLRPDWVAIVYGSQLEPDSPAHAIDGELLGYVYCNGGFSAGNQNKPRTLLPEEVAHWSPLPDPENAGIGMSWVTPALRDLRGDVAATEHKLKFFENGATANMVVKGIDAANSKQFNEIVDMLESQHTGLSNAYKTLYLTSGADATVVGSDMKQLDFKNTQGMGETRITYLSRVPAPMLGISEGLAGSSLNQGNFAMSRRNFSDTWVYPSLQDVSAALAPLVNVPAGAELWFDVTDIPLLREDAKDAAAIEQIKAATIRQLVDGGFEPASVIAAVQGQDMTLLKHTGLLSVQLQAPGTTPGSAAVDAAPQPKALPKGSGS